MFELNPKNSVSDTSLCGFIPMALVQDGFGFSHSYELRVWRDVKKGYSHFQNGDIGIAKISPCFENRKSTIFYGLPNGIGAGTTELTILRPIVVDAEFYLFLFQSIWYITEGTKDFIGVVGQQRVNKVIFTPLAIPIPPIAEQKRITTEIKRYFHFVELIEYNKETLIRNTLTTKSKILELAMQGKLVPQDPTDEPAADMLKRINPKAKIITDNPHCRNIPSGWVMSTLKELIAIPSSKPYQIFQSEINEDGSIPVISQSSNFIEGYSDCYDKAFHPNNGIVIFGDHTKNVKFFSEDFIIGADGVKLIDWDYNKQYLYYLIKYVSEKIPSKGYSRHFQYLASYVIGLPPLNEQKRIVNKIEELFATLNHIEISLKD